MILVEPFGQLCQIPELAFVHGDRQLLDFQTDLCFECLWLDHQLCLQLNWLEQVVRAVLVNFRPLLHRCQHLVSGVFRPHGPNEYLLVRFVIKPEVNYFKQFVQGHSSAFGRCPVNEHGAPVLVCGLELERLEGGPQTEFLRAKI